MVSLKYENTMDKVNSVTTQCRRNLKVTAINIKRDNQTNETSV